MTEQTNAFERRQIFSSSRRVSCILLLHQQSKQATKRDNYSDTSGHIAYNYFHQRFT